MITLSFVLVIEQLLGVYSMKDKEINELAEKITFNELYKLIRKTVQLGWVDFTEEYTNELGDFENYKNVFLESVDEELDQTDEPVRN